MKQETPLDPKNTEIQTDSNKSEQAAQEADHYPRQGQTALLNLLEDLRQEIEARKRTEAMILESETRYRTVADFTLDWETWLTPEATYAYVSPSCETITGYSADEFYRSPHLSVEIVIPEDRPEMESHWAWVKEAARLPCRREFRIRTAQGQIRWIQHACQSVYDRSGRYLGRRSSHRDTTDQKRIEESLRQSEARLTQAAEAGNVGLWDWDLGTNRVYYSPEWKRQIGYENHEISDDLDEWQSRVHPDDLGPSLQTFRSFVENPRPGLDIEFRFRHKDGSYRWILARGSIVCDAGGKAFRVLGSHVDITEQKQVQRRLLGYQTRLRSLASRLALTEERERRNLAERLHDDISQSLAFCKMKLEMIRKAEQDPSLVTGLTQVCDTLSQLLANTRAMTFDVYSPVLKVLGFEAAVSSWLREEVQQKHDIRTEFYDDQQPKCLGDSLKALVFRSVRELLNNAVKHAHADLIRVSISRDRDVLCVEVEDDGQGLVPEEAVSPNAKGFGLFSIQERLAELGGSVEIDAAPGEGCRVLIRVPLEIREDAQG